jgi:CBS domain-containing protein
MGNTLLAPSRVRSAAGLPEHLPFGDIEALTPQDSAYRALTDFNHDYPITEPTGRTVDDTLSDMVRLGVHAMVVTKPQAEGAQQVVGLITAYDIRHRRSDKDIGNAPIEDVMTSWDELPLVRYESLQALTALDVHEMFQGTGLTHLLVIEDHGGDSASARGLISRASLARRLRGAGVAGPHGDITQ